MSILEGAVIPADEPERMEAVHRYAVLDTPPDGAFDRITALAARVFNVPIAIVSVVDHDRIWLKSHHGLEIEEIDRAPGLCASAILQDGPWVIENAPQDPRALTNPLVAGEFGLKFYAGIPLTVAGGHRLGTLCILDFEPRVLTDEETSTLTDLAEMVVGELELRLASRRAIEAAGEREKLNDAFIGMLSHELRTPITTIYAAARVLANQGVIQADPLANDLFPDIVSESERLLRLIEDLLVLTKVEQDSLEGSSEPVLVQRVIERTLARLERRHPEREFHLVGGVALPPVAGDEVFVEQILANLLSNAAKYSPSDTPIEIRAALRNGAVEVRVRDRGIGMTAAEREAVFALLVRTDEAQRYAPGAGIGLYVCRRLAQVMGGRVWAEAPPDGVGSVFGFQLPVASD